MAPAVQRSKLTPDEYLGWERKQSERHEYFLGDIFAMAGGSPRHNALAMQIGAALNAALRSRGCFALTSDQRIGLGGRYVYPDVSVVCGPRQFEAGTTDVIVNPSIVVEVLSAGTEPYDRGLKWDGYQRLTSLTDYLLVSQSQARVEHFLRNSDGSWTYRTLAAGGRIVLANACAIDIDAIYADVLALESDEIAPGS